MSNLLKELKNFENLNIANFLETVILIQNYIKNFSFNEMDEFKIDVLMKCLGSIEHEIKAFKEKINFDLFEKDEKTKNEIQNFRYYCNCVERVIKSFRQCLNSNQIQLINKPFLIVCGEAGIGKSFLFGKVTDERRDNQENTILLLGHQFNVNENPESRICSELGINNHNFDEFLDALESKAMIQKSRILILIDAINEGMGLDVWNNYFNPFIDKISKRRWLGCAISIRDKYFNELNMNSDVSNLITKKQYYGFQENIFEATTQFFNHYGIQNPNTPILNPEFSNPLFLKYFCLALSEGGYNTIPDGMQGISKIMNSFVLSINKKLSKKSNYYSSINIVDEVLNQFVKCEMENDNTFLDSSFAYKIVMDVLNKYSINDNKFLDYLIDEGILIKVLSSDKKELIGITFQRLNDYIACELLLSNINNCDDLKKEFGSEGSLYKFIKDENSISHNINLIEMLSIIIPEKYSIEFYEIVPNDFLIYPSHLQKIYHENLVKKYEKIPKSTCGGIVGFIVSEKRFKVPIKGNLDIIKSFLSSLKWRKYSSIDENIFDYIDDYVLRHSETFNEFLNLMIILSPIEQHILNANKSHEFLFKMNLGNRDSFWIPYIQDNSFEDNPLNQLLNLGFPENKSIYSNESIKLSSIMMAWFLASTNINLRNTATKSLINLLKDNMDILIDLLKKFERINDPYIYERLFAVAYGCSLLTKDLKSLKILSKYIYEEIFNKNEIYPNILLRDYARNIIEFCLIKNTDLKIDADKIRPPYKSKFPEIPLDKEIKKYEDKSQSPQNDILYSMQVEHDRDGQSTFYGDFGRYVFQSAFEMWRDKVNYNDLMNIAIKRVFDLGWDVKKHGDFDSKVKSSCRQSSSSVERIGKKYQWIALYELLAQVSDKYPTLNQDYIINDGEIPYRGPWQEYIRNIDPTCINPSEKIDVDVSIFENFYKLPENLDEEWVDYISDLSDPKELIEVNLKVSEDKFNGLILEGNFSWKEESKFGEEKYNTPYKYTWYQIRSYMIFQDDFKSIFNYLKYKNFMGRWMPESAEFHQIFNKEFYQSKPFDYFHKNGLDENRNLKINNNSLKLVIPTLNYYSVEEDRDEKNSFIKISKKLFDDLNLSFGDFNSDFCSQDGSLVGFDAYEFGSSSSNLVFKKDILLKYLEDSNLKIIFTVLGEKMIVQGGIGNNKRLDISGVYYFDDEEKLKGELIPYSEFHFNEMRGSFLGIVIKEKVFDDYFNENGQCYFDKNNSIIYYFMKSENLDFLNLFNKRESYKKKIIGNKSWFYYYLPKNESSCGNNSIENILNFGGGFIFYTSENDEYYICIVRICKLNVNGNLTSGLYKKYISYLLENIVIHKKPDNSILDILNDFEFPLDENELNDSTD